MKNDELIVFNHYYRLKHDQKRSYILSPESDYPKIAVNNGLLSKIHPIYAMIFSFFSRPIQLGKAIDEISYFLDMPQDSLRTFITGLIGNNEMSHCLSKDGAINNFPSNILIKESDAFAKEVQYTPQQFAYTELDMATERMITGPVSILLMINNTCVTQCCYCYADKKTKANLMSFEQIKALIKKAYEANVFEFMISGGEIFLHENWQELVEELMKYGYKPPLLSTKVPINETDINKLKKYDIRLQISLDSLNSAVLSKMLIVNSKYAEKIKQTIAQIDQKGVPFQIATVITKYNEQLESLEEIYNFLSRFKNLLRWEVRIAFRSLYSREDFDQIKISKVSEQKISDWVKNKQKSTDMNIIWTPSEGGNRYFQCDSGSSNFTGARCSANYCNIVCMPDGKVTLCEQLYWNPRFIIGDVSTQSIEEVWNSPRALKLVNLKKEDFRDASVCKQCNIFSECYSFPNKCYAEVLKAYGDENWDYPDPRCKYAPPFIYDLLNS